MKLPYGESNQSPELDRQAAEAVYAGLLNAFAVHESLGSEGVNSKQQNQFGETALVADVKAEEAVLAALYSVNARIEVLSEEHGTVVVNEDNTSGVKLLGVLDGLDGSSVYQKERGTGRYGTMFALFANDDPRYSEYLAAGIMEHSTRRLLLALKGQPLQIIDVNSGVSHVSSTRSAVELSAETVAYVDNGKVEPDNKLYEYFEQNGSVFAEPLRRMGVNTLRTGSSAAYYTAVASGEADIVGESTRKGNLEFATAYAVVTSAGGAMRTLDGHDLGQQKFREFGQTEHVPILTAANTALADSLMAIL